MSESAFVGFSSLTTLLRIPIIQRNLALVIDLCRVPGLHGLVYRFNLKALYTFVEEFPFLLLRRILS